MPEPDAPVIEADDTEGSDTPGPVVIYGTAVLHATTRDGGE